MGNVATPGSRDDQLRTVDDTGSVKLSFIAQELEDVRKQEHLRQAPTTVNLYTSHTVGRRRPTNHQAQDMTQMAAAGAQPRT